MRLCAKLRCAFIALTSIALASPAHADFSKIAFKYTSLTHLGYRGSLAHTGMQVPETVDLIATYLRSNGATVTAIQENPSKIVQTDGDLACEQWMQSIFRAEFAAYDANKFRQFEKIDRTSMPTGCSVPKASWLQYGYSAIPIQAGVSFKIEAVLDRSIDLTRPTSRVAYSSIFGQYSSTGVWSVLPSSITTRQNFETRIVIFVWRDAGDSKTSVYAIGVPRSNGIEASPQAGIGYAFRHYVDGKIESEAVGNVLAYVVQKSLVHRP